MAPDLPVCIVCSGHVDLAPRAAADGGLHVAAGYADDHLVDDYWVHFRCIGAAPGTGEDTEFEG